MSPDNKGLSVHHYSLSSKKEKAMFYGVKGKIQSQAHFKPFLKVFCLKQVSLTFFSCLPLSIFRLLLRMKSPPLLCNSYYSFFPSHFFLWPRLTLNLKVIWDDGMIRCVLSVRNYLHLNSSHSFPYLLFSHSSSLIHSVYLHLPSYLLSLQQLVFNT